LIGLMIGGCDAQSVGINAATSTPFILPTLMELPSETPSEIPPVPTDTTTPELFLTAQSYLTETARAIPTANPVETALAEIRATSEASQRLIETLQAQMTQPAPQPSNGQPAPTPTITATLSVQAIPPTMLYAPNATGVYACALEGCALVGQIQAGALVVADGVIDGNAINVGNTRWYRLNLNGTAVYSYSGDLTIPPTATARPFATVIPPVSAPNVIPAPPITCPRNCTEAVLWGVTAEQAAACGLDRDGDGVACYGD
jgi:hypothetical protein